MDQKRSQECVRALVGRVEKIGVQVEERLQRQLFLIIVTVNGYFCSDLFYFSLPCFFFLALPKFSSSQATCVGFCEDMPSVLWHAEVLRGFLDRSEKALMLLILLPCTWPGWGLSHPYASFGRCEDNSAAGCT